MPASRFSAGRLFIGWALGVMAPVLAPQPLPGPLLWAAAALLTVTGRREALALGMAAGLLFGGYALQAALDARLDPCLDGAEALLIGRVMALPQGEPASLRFDFEPEALHSRERCARAAPQKLRLSWYQAPELLPGERWRLLVKLRAPRGMVNPSAFDYERWLFSNGIDASGYVQRGRRIEPAAGLGWDRWRHAVRDVVAELGLREPGVVLALMTGDAELMPDGHWPLFRATGTVHLMVISGLHLTLVGGLGWLLGRLLGLGLPGWSARWPARHLAGATALALTTLYGFCAGWGLPVRRAWIMTSVTLLWLMQSRRVHPWHVFWFALAVNLALEPLAPLTPGFWLSYGAVAVLLAYFLPRSPRERAPIAMLRAQLVLFAAMAPLLLATVGQLAWAAPVANLLAVPVVTLAIVPFVLLAAALMPLAPSAAARLLHLPDRVAGWLLDYLRWLAEPGYVHFVAGLPWSALLLGLAGALAVLLPLPLRWRWLVLPPLLALFPRPDAGPPFGEFRVTTLDVGQGLAVLVETAHHRLVYDAGARYPSGFDIGESVVVPVIRARGARSVEMLMLSHEHNDHAGGAAAVAERLEPRSRLAGGAFAGLASHERCHAGQRWQWDGVRFEVLYPRGARRLPANEGSCVLRIDNGRRAALLPGDIERSAERALLRRGLLSPVDLLIAPHHGSSTSSTAPFLAALAPRIVFVSAGHRNRFDHPHAEVLQRYAALGAQSYVTATSGALRWTSTHPETVHQHRHHHSPYWRPHSSRLPTSP